MGTKKIVKQGLMTAGVYFCINSATVIPVVNKTGDTETLAEKSVKVTLDGGFRQEMDLLTVNLHPPEERPDLPAKEYYSTWDSDYVHPYPGDLFNMQDTVTLVLDGLYDCGYIPPANSKITSGFGYRHGRYHYGVDLDIAYGEAIFNSFDGKVRVAKYEPSYGYVVVVRHYNGLETVYAHLSQLSVEEGDDVRSGSVVGLGGNTGQSTGSHLHFEIRFQGQPIDPEQVISFGHQQLNDDTLRIYRSNHQYLAVQDEEQNVSS